MGDCPRKTGGVGGTMALRQHWRAVLVLAYTLSLGLLPLPTSSSSSSPAAFASRAGGMHRAGVAGKRGGQEGRDLRAACACAFAHGCVRLHLRPGHAHCSLCACTPTPAPAARKRPAFLYAAVTASPPILRRACSSSAVAARTVGPACSGSALRRFALLRSQFWGWGAVESSGRRQTTSTALHISRRERERLEKGQKKMSRKVSRTSLPSSIDRQIWSYFYYLIYLTRVYTIFRSASV